MSRKIMKYSDLAQSLARFMRDSKLEDARVSMDTKTGTATVTGRRDGLQYTTTVRSNLYGTTQTPSVYAVNVGRDALINQVKQLRGQGYKQNDIATMLGISQVSVSKYLRM